MKRILSKVNWRRVLSYVLVAALASGATWAIAPRTSKLENLATIIGNRFIGEADETKIKDAAANAMVQALDDRWSYYIPAEAYSAHVNNQNNEYVGVGITIMQRSDGTGYDIVEVNSGGPAEAAGLLAGDVLTHVDGESTADLDITALKSRIMGKQNTQVQITVLRGTETKTFSVTRKRIHTSAASGQMLADHVGYVSIQNFHNDAGKESIAVIEDLLAQGARALVLDVRDNPGGYVNEMVKLLDYLLPEGPLFRSVSYTGREDVDESDADCLELPMAVLMNGNTYSAAEFFAAALQEYNWAVTVGEPTTGKGYYQTTIELGDGSAVQLSTGAYTTPNGVNLTEVGGLQPDIPITADAQTADITQDPQIKAALQAVTEQIQ